MSRTNAERQAAFRTRQKAGLPKVKVVRCQPADRRSRKQRWEDAVVELVELQAEYQTWLDTMPPGGSEATREALEALCEVDLSELEGIEAPTGFGRD